MKKNAMLYKILVLPAFEVQRRLNIVWVEEGCRSRKMFVPEEER